jgi:DNA-binding transcriptional regulator GbsR (MarR family)
MTVFDLMERLGGEIVMNRVRALIDGKIVVIAILNGQEWEYTEAGQALYNEHSNLAAEEAKPVKAPKASKSKQAQVESVEPQPEQEPQAEAEQSAVETEQAPAAE